MNDARRRTDSYGMRRHIRIDHSIGANAAMVADRDAANNFRACSDINVIADHRRALALTARQVVRADRHLLKNGDVPANLRFIRNKNTPPLGPRSVLCVVVVTTCAYGIGLG